jgi:hypothetical protein
LACQDELFVNNRLDIKENYEHALDFAFYLSGLFSVSVSLDSSSERLVALSRGLQIKRDVKKILVTWTRRLHLHRSFVGSVVKSHQARYMTPNKRT